MDELMAGDSNQVETASFEVKNATVLSKSDLKEEKMPCSDAPSLPLRMTEIMGLMQTLNKQLEELAIEQRTGVSQMQWAALEEFKSSCATGTKSVKFRRNSMFSRTYFLDKDMDECFQNIMKNCSIFYEDLKNVNGKVQCRSDGENRPEEDSEDQSVANEDDEVEAMRRSFTKLIRAKIDFDTRFIGFNEQIFGDSCTPQQLRSLSANFNLNHAERNSSGDDGRAADKKSIARSKRAARGVTKKSRREQPKRSTRIASEVKITRRRYNKRRNSA